MQATQVGEVKMRLKLPWARADLHGQLLDLVQDPINLPPTPVSWTVLPWVAAGKQG